MDTKGRDLIDRQSLLDKLDAVARSTYDNSKPGLTWDRAVAFIYLEPSVEEKENKNEV